MAAAARGVKGVKRGSCFGQTLYVYLFFDLVRVSDASYIMKVISVYATFKFYS